jgi:hypothetical protein
MDYKKIYDRFIEDRRQHPTGEIRAEIHHIIPISAGGDVCEANCIRLSIRDHIFAHKVLRRLGLDPTGPHKRMSKAIAAEIYARMADQPVAAYGRGKTSVSAKVLAKMVKKKEKELIELGNEMTDKFLQIIDPGVEKYAYRIGRAKKFNTKVLTFFANMVPCIAIDRLDRLPQNDSRELPDEPEKFSGRSEFYSSWAADNKIFLSYDGQVKQSFFPTKINEKFLKCNAWQGLLFRWVYPALKNLYDDIMNHGGRMKPEGAVICRSEEEFKQFRVEAAIYGYYMTTKLKPGTYKVEDIVGWACQGIQMLLLQHTALYHLRDLADVDFVDVYDTALLKRLQELPGKALGNPDDYDTYFECLAAQVLKHALGNIAFTQKRKDELMPIAMQGAYAVRDQLHTAIMRVRDNGFTEKEAALWQIVAKFIAKHGFEAVHAYIEKGGIAA